MSLMSDLREDVRLARINRPAYAFIFNLFDAATVLFRVLVVAAFGLGIWHLMHLGSNPQSSLGVVAGLQAAQQTPEELPAPELTPERVARLQRLAGQVADPQNKDAVVVPAVAAALPADKQIAVSAELLPDPVSGEIVVDSSAEVDKRDVQVAGEGSDAAGPALEAGEDAGKTVIAQTTSQTQNEAFTTSDEVAVADELQADVAVQAVVANNGSSAAAAGPLPTAQEDTVVALTANDSSADAAPETDGDAAIPVAIVRAGAGEKNQKTDKVQPAIFEEAWVLAQSSDHYLIQIGSTINRPFLEQFAQQFPDELPAAVFRFVLREDSGPQFGLSVGVFERREEAETALAGLSQSARRYGAFVRPLGVVQKQIRDANLSVSMSLEN